MQSSANETKSAEQVNKRPDKRVARYLCRDTWLFWTSVDLSREPPTALSVRASFFTPEVSSFRFLPSANKTLELGQQGIKVAGHEAKKNEKKKPKKFRWSKEGKAGQGSQGPSPVKWNQAREWYQRKMDRCTLKDITFALDFIQFTSVARL